MKQDGKVKLVRMIQILTDHETPKFVIRVD